MQGLVCVENVGRKFEPGTCRKGGLARVSRKGVSQGGSRKGVSQGYGIRNRLDMSRAMRPSLTADNSPGLTGEFLLWRGREIDLCLSAVDGGSRGV